MKIEKKKKQSACRKKKELRGKILIKNRFKIYSIYIICEMAYNISGLATTNHINKPIQKEKRTNKLHKIVK